MPVASSPGATPSATSRALVLRGFGYVGRRFTDVVVARLGALVLLVGRTGRGVAARSVRLRDVAYQVQAVGVRSLGLVVTMAAFAGMVLAFQFGYGLERFGAKLYIGQTTVTALVRELGPILTALVAGGRIGAGIAAELGGMAVTEQLDAVRALGADPVQRLVAPRILAVTLAMPLLTVVADAVGTAGGLVVAWLQYGVPPRLFVSGVEEFVTISDFGSGLIKGARLRRHRRRHLLVGGRQRHRRHRRRGARHHARRRRGGADGARRRLPPHQADAVAVMESAVHIEGVKKAFDEKRIYDGLDLDVRRGETLVVLGPSGAGKSVLLKLIIGLYRVDAGRIVVGGVDVTELDEGQLREVRRKAAMLFQGAALFDSMSVGENVAYGLYEHYQWPEARVRARVAECLEAVGLPGIEAMHPADLSGGMKKRVGLARALAPGPEIILYDEPTTGLDPSNARRINELINSLQERLGVTSIVITHDIDAALAVADRIALLQERRIALVVDRAAAEGSPPPPLERFMRGEDVDEQGP